MRVKSRAYIAAFVVICVTLAVFFSTRYRGQPIQSDQGRTRNGMETPAATFHQIPPDSPTSQPHEAISILERKRKCDALSAQWSFKNQDDMSAGTCRRFKEYCGVASCQSMLDLVYLWVNGSEPVFMKSLRETQEGSSHAGHQETPAVMRFRELGQFRYALRSVALNLPWHRRIFIVTQNQVPSWLDTDHLQIRMVNHSSLFPPGSPLLFNSMAIQSRIHQIPTLSSPFLYSEDDIYYGKYVPLSMLWGEDGRNQVFLAASINAAANTGNAFEESVQTSMSLVKATGRDTSLFHQKKGRLLLNSHVSMMLFPEALEDMWRDHPKEMSAMASHSFRSPEDPHIWSLYVYRDGLQRANAFNTKQADHAFLMWTSKVYKDVIGLLTRNRWCMVCVNDNFEDPAESVLDEVEKFYEALFPAKSSFELS